MELYSRQLGFLIFMYLLGSALIFVPESIITQDVWISTILASFVGLYLLHILIVLQELYPGQSIMQIAELAFGKLVGQVLNLLYIWSILLVAMLILFDAMVFLKIIYLTTPEILLAIAMMCTSCYVIFHGLIAIGRLSDIFIWPIIALVVLGFAASFPLFDYSNIPPILANVKQIFGGTIYAANWPFAELVVIALLLPYVVDLKKNKKHLYFWFGAGSIALTIRSLLVLGILGKYLEVSRYPFYDIFRLVQFQEFQRVELFFFILFFTTVMSAIVITHKTLVLGLQHFFRLKSRHALVVPVGFLILALMYDSFPSDVGFLATQAASTVFVTFPIYILYPTMVFIMAKLKHRKNSRKDIEVRGEV